ncbi:hypothetical protein HBI56_200400 [Parastagonospora nodorum]|uniref:Uncharacterized protein n=1 Tax=Phaeosphaeria nodorum (strain SN15 / ATCC MYA-4574 / FGSC 10173) TaxID=321614 RepID=A0A7U2EVE5_PHANO|nr:hypothetical protein HBH56_214940 [Parastagonospora nodorum]QRC93803.1 hypothetical protein JI435_404520 [Parastagonospora nodorum SN15]KAH3961395.1 hypothetical protein HBH51_183630 [Parastagonospora nodorum]KAH3963249.1 hypothetical protein HBH52_218940 [Parastagonospora nodorum]KAH3992475.1 hypothetical protein HBI10_214480 [Parastagonospora nodorum]
MRRAVESIYLDCPSLGWHMVLGCIVPIGKIRVRRWPEAALDKLKPGRKQL